MGMAPAALAALVLPSIRDVLASRQRAGLLVCALALIASTGCRTSNRFVASNTVEGESTNQILAATGRGGPGVVADPYGGGVSVTTPAVLAPPTVAVGPTMGAGGGFGASSASYGDTVIDVGPPLAMGAAPPRSAATLESANPNPNLTGARNRRRTTMTPRPGELGEGLELTPSGPEIAGRVVNAYGRAEPGATIRVRPLSTGDGMSAAAADGQGAFRLRQLQPGIRYEVSAEVVRAGRRLLGSTIVVPPDTGVVVQVDEESANAVTRSPNRNGAGGARFSGDLEFAGQPNRQFTGPRDVDPAPTQGAVSVETTPLIVPVGGTVPWTPVRSP